jgi:hypothetical protein
VGRVHLHPGKTGLLHRRCAYSEAAHDILNLGNGERHRIAELSARQTQLYRRGCLGVWIDELLGLAAGMADLGPEMVAIAGSRPGPARQRLAHCGIGLALDDHVARALQVSAVHNDVPGQEQPRAAVAPKAIEPLQRRRGHTLRRRQALGHGSLGQAIGYYRAARQRERTDEHIRHAISPVDEPISGDCTDRHPKKERARNVVSDDIQEVA